MPRKIGAASPGFVAANLFRDDHAVERRVVALRFWSRRALCSPLHALVGFGGGRDSPRVKCKANAPGGSPSKAAFVQGTCKDQVSA